MSVFKRIGIIIYRADKDTYSTFQRLFTLLYQENVCVVLSERTQSLCLEDMDTAKLLSQYQVPSTTETSIGDECELIIVIGGDGSMLHIARETLTQGLPILGINRGRLGFLNDISPDDIEIQIKQILDGNYITSKRFLLEAIIERDNQVVEQFQALNDVVVQSERSRIIDLSLSIDNNFVYKIRADGLIFATPTGSTAYALACGGTIVHPSLSTIQIVPINSHSLDNRPIVVDSSVQLDVAVTEHNHAKVQAVGDGQVHVPVEVGDKLKIKRHTRQTTFLHLKNHNFYESCRTKLNWNKLG